MAKETFCIDLDNIAELRELRHMLDEKIAAIDSASIEQGMRKIRDSIGFEAANKLFDAIEDCDMVDCTMDEFTKDYDGDVKAALKDSFPAVFEAIPKGAKIYDSVATLVGVMDSEWEKDKDSGIMYTAPEPKDDDPNLIEGWAEAKNQFNACKDDCMLRVDSYVNSPYDGWKYAYNSLVYIKIDNLIYSSYIKPDETIGVVALSVGLNEVATVVAYNKLHNDHLFALETSRNPDVGKDVATFVCPIPQPLYDNILKSLIANDDEYDYASELKVGKRLKEQNRVTDEEPAVVEDAGKPAENGETIVSEGEAKYMLNGSVDTIVLLEQFNAKGEFVRNVRAYANFKKTLYQIDCSNGKLTEITPDKIDLKSTSAFDEIISYSDGTKGFKDLAAQIL